jgi:hypothetical protein
VRNGRLLMVTVLASAMLAACGGDSDSPAAAAAAAAPSSGGGAAAGAAGGGGGIGVVASGKGAATLSWLPPTTNDDGTALKLKGYRLYWGQTEGHYTGSVTLDNPGLTRYVVEQLAPATWYFVATALSDSAESPPSNVVVMQIR